MFIGIEKCHYPTTHTNDIVKVCCILGIFLLSVYTSYKICSSRSFKQFYAIFWKADAEVLWQKLMEYLSYSGSACKIVKIAFFRFVIVDEPEDVQVVLNSSSTLKKSGFYRLFQNVVGDGLFTAAVEKWRIHRRLIRPTFNIVQLERLFPSFNHKTKMLILKLSDKCDTGTSIDLWKYLFLNSLNSVCETMMNFHIGSDDEIGLEFERALARVSEADAMRIYKIWLRPDVVFNLYTYLVGIFEYFRGLRKLPEEILKEGRMKYEKQEASQNENDDARGFFMRTLLRSREDKYKFSDGDIFDEIITMLIGGSEASALTLCFTLLMLSMHQGIQEKVYEEIVEIMGKENEFVGLEHVQRMSYLEQCIKETLRLFPVGPLLLRETTKQTKLSNNLIIPAGTNVIVPVIRIHRDARIFKNPSEWEPDNFSAEELNKRHRYTFLGFSAGPRGCIGSNYALLSMKVTLSSLLLRYKFTTDIKMEDIKLKVDLMLRSANGFRVKLHRRFRE